MLYRNLAVSTLICFSACAQGLIIPQISDGGGWQTSIVLTNPGTNPASASLTFYMDTGGGATQIWSPTFIEGVSTQAMTIPAGGTLLLHTLGTDPATTTGWSQLAADPGVAGYAVLTQSSPGLPNQNGVATAAAPVNRMLVPFDNTNGGSTAVTVVNTSSSDQTIAVAFRTPDGTLTQASLPDLPSQGHMMFPLAQQFPALAAQSGLAEFYSSGATFSLSAQRSDATGAMADAPVYSQTGNPILVTTGPSGGSSLPPFSSIVVTGTFSPDGQSSYQVNITIATLGPTMRGTVTTTGVYVLPAYTVAAFSAAFPTVGINGYAFTFGGFQPGNGGSMEDKTFTMYGITAASLSLTLSPQTVVTTGNATGTLSLTSSLATLSGSFSGIYILNP